MDLFTQILDACRTVDHSAAVTYAGLGALAGAIVMPAIVCLGMRFNLKRIRTIYQAVGIPETRQLYRLMAITGAALVAIVVGSQPYLDAAGGNEVYIRGALLPVIMIVIFIPLVRALKRLRGGV